MRVSLEKQHGEPLQKHAWRGWNKHKHRLKWPQSASVAVSEPHCTADVCSVNCLSINCRESPLYSRAGTYEVILGGYGTLKNDYMTFYICHVTCKCEKNISIAVLRIISFSNCLKNHLMRALKTFLRYMGVFAKLMRFH